MSSAHGPIPEAVARHIAFDRRGQSAQTAPPDQPHGVHRGAARHGSAVSAHAVAGLHRPMRHVDREVLRPTEIGDILQSCPIVRVSYTDARGRTIVPMGFAYTYVPSPVDEFGPTAHPRAFGALNLYVHSATGGRGTDAIRGAGDALPVAFEMDCDRTLFAGSAPRALTVAHRSIIGTGTAHIIDDPREKRRRLAMLLERRDGGLGATDAAHADEITVWRIVAHEFTAKHHPAA